MHYAYSLEVMTTRLLNRAKDRLRRLLALFSSLAIPLGCLRVVLWNSNPFLVTDGKIICGTSVALLGGLAIPRNSFGVILRHPLAKVVHEAQVELG